MWIWVGWVSGFGGLCVDFVGGAYSVWIWGACGMWDRWGLYWGFGGELCVDLLGRLCVD